MNKICATNQPLFLKKPILFFLKHNAFIPGSFSTNNRNSLSPLFFILFPQVNMGNNVPFYGSEKKEGLRVIIKQPGKPSIFR
jgi:hypothetical protein